MIDHKSLYFPKTRSEFAARFKALVCGRSPAEIMDSNPTGGMDVHLLWVLCIVQLEVSATNSSLVQKSPTDCGASLCVI